MFDLLCLLTFLSVCGSPVETQVHPVEPYTKQELSLMCLPDIIYLYSLKTQKNITENPLLYLYPDIPKDTAFGRYYKISGSLFCLTPPPLRTKLELHSVGGKNKAPYTL